MGQCIGQPRKFVTAYFLAWLLLLALFSTSFLVA
jgi:hypothetical protein